LSQQLFYLLECLDGNPHQSALLAPAFRGACPEFPVASVLEPYHLRRSRELLDESQQADLAMAVRTLPEVR